MSSLRTALLRRAMKIARNGCLDLTVGNRGNSIRILERILGFSVYLLWPTSADVAKPYKELKLPPIDQVRFLV